MIYPLSQLNLREETIQQIAPNMQTIATRCFFWTSLGVLASWTPGAWSSRCVAAIGAASLCDLVPKIWSLKEQVAELSRALLQKNRAKPISFRESAPFDLPCYLDRLSPEELARFNQNQPIRFFFDRERAGLFIDGREITPEEIGFRLPFIHHRYPKISRILISHLPSSPESLFESLALFTKLSFLRLSKSRLSEKLLLKLQQRLPDLRWIDVQYSSGISSSFCENWARIGIITRPDGSSNSAQLFAQLDEQDREIKAKIYQMMLNLKKRELETQIALADSVKQVGALQKEMTDLATLEQLIASPDKFSDQKALIQLLKSEIDCTHFPEEIQEKLFHDFKTYVESRRQIDLTLLEFPYTHKIPSEIMFNDQIFAFHLRSIQQRGDFLVELDLSYLPIPAASLPLIAGLPLEKLLLCKIAHLDLNSLRCLKELPFLTELDLSETPIDETALIQHVAPLHHLKKLHLNQCAKLTSSGFQKNLLFLFPQLQWLSLLDSFQITSNDIERWIQQSAELAIAWTDQNQNRLDLSASDSLQQTILKTLQTCLTAPIEHLRFGAGSLLKRADFEELFSLPSLFHLKELDLRGSSIEDPAVFSQLTRNWPLEKIRFKTVSLETRLLSESPLPKAEAVEIQTQNPLPPEVWHYLESLNEIDHLRLIDCPLSASDFDRIASLCKQKKVSYLYLQIKDLREDHLSTLDGLPKEFVRTLFGCLNYLNLEKSQVSKKIFSDWKWDIPNHPFCHVKIGDGSTITYAVS